MSNNQWKAEIDGSMSSETDGFRLEIRDVGGMARFLILRQTEIGTRSRELVASGSQMNERLAMTAALEVAGRLRRSLLLDPSIGLLPQSDQYSFSDTGAVAVAQTVKQGPEMLLRDSKG